ncbi:RnfABCDGE type electron transport complex subunit D [Klebsiella pneumoniae]|nr:RnfABCDGE type electron transport complex subunit D [Klebsiella pneumoniae]
MPDIAFSRCNCPVYGGVLAGLGWQWVNNRWLAGGLSYLWRRRSAGISRSASLLASACAPPSAQFFAAGTASPQMHLLSGATAGMRLTDPVTASTTNRGRLIFRRPPLYPAGLAHPPLRWLSDGVAFAVLLANITVPLIGYYTPARM